MLGRFTPLFLALPPCLLSAGAVEAQQDRVQGDAALEPLAGSLAAYFEARASGLGLDRARSDVAQRLEELKPALEGKHPLWPSRDLGRAFWSSHGYGARKVKKGKVLTEELERGSFAVEGMELSYRLPKDYAPDRRAYPLILAIPDADEEPAAHLRASWTLREILDGAILVCPGMPAERAEWDRVAVDGRPGGLCHVLSALRFAEERFAVDFERVYVAGRGKGVPAAVAAGNHAPQRFAGIIGRAGDLGDQGPENFSNLATYFAGAGARGTAFHEACQSAGFDNCTLDAAGTEEDLWRWILAHTRRTHPEEVTLVVGKPFPTRAYWLRVAPTAPDAHATATIERGSNAVRVESAGVSYVTLYLNDALVDLDRPVHVLCNGVEVTARVPRRLTTTLDLLADGTSDAACVYVAEAFLDATGATPASSTDAPDATDPEFAERLAAAEGNAERLWELHLRCEASGRPAPSARVLRRILLLEPDHADAREALGYRGIPGAWFRSEEAFARFRRSQEEEVALARGSLRSRVGWIHSDERSLANKGWVKDWASGQWLSGGDRRRLEEGWVRQDLEWIPPEEAFHVADGLWRVDGEWVELEVANRRHARIDSMWRITSPDVLLSSTADRDVSLRAIEQMARAIPDLCKVFGAAPVLPLKVALLRDEEQYDSFAFGDPDGRRRATDPARMHVVHSAFFAESWFPRVEGEPVFDGMGVTYWDPLVPYGDLYGVHAARLAVGLSFVEALDPSPKTVRKALAGGPRGDYHKAYQAEKRLPAWLRTGGAVYAERYFHDEGVGPDGDPWWARAWSLGNLRDRGGMRSLDEIFAFRLDPADRDDGLKLLIEAGLLVAFVVDGECAPVEEAHAELKRALLAGSVVPSDVEALTKAIAEHEAELRAFAGL